MDQDLINLQNKRKATRFIRKDIKVFYVKSNFWRSKETVNCHLLDISSTGMQISTDKKIKLNTVLDFTLQFNTKDEFKFKAKVVWNKKNNSYKSKLSFSTINEILIHNSSSLETLNLFENKELIFAKFRNLKLTQVQILTYSPLKKDKQHSLVFTLSDKSTHKLGTKIESYKHYRHNCYGITFEKQNNDLGDCLLETQTNLIFK